jgi:hypothetical protein
MRGGSLKALGIALSCQACSAGNEPSGQLLRPGDAAIAADGSSAPGPRHSPTAPDPRGQLQKRARLVDLAREAVAARDLTAAKILLSYARANVDAIQLTTPDARALALAVDCMQEADEEAQEAAAAFLREVHGSVLRKLLRRACSADGR